MSDLPDGQQSVINEMPATSGEIAGALGITKSAVRGRIKRIREVHGWDSVRRDDATGEYSYHDVATDGGVAEARPVRPGVMGISDKARYTREFRKAVGELDREFADMVSSLPVLEANPSSRPNHEDVVFHVTDDHFGDVVHGVDETGRTVETFSPEIAAERAQIRAQRALNLAELQSGIVTYDTLHYLIGGDMVTGTGHIYPGQSWHLGASLREQINIASNSHIQSVVSFIESGLFEHIHIVMVPGNHGRLEGGDTSPDDNGDNMVYDRIEAVLTLMYPEDVSFTRATGDRAVFRTRGGAHTSILYHGHTVPRHASTNAMKGRWFPKMIVDPDSGELADVAYAGHFHNHKIEDLHGRKIVWSGSLKPADDFADQLGLFSYPCSFIHGVSDKFPMTWQYPIYFY